LRPVAERPPGVCVLGVEVMAKRKPIGRPSDFNAATVETICNRLADGESLRAICADAKMPDKTTVLRWLTKHEDFRTQYARAREVQAERMAEDILAIADDGENDTYVDDEGNQRTDHDVIARSRLRVDTRKWLMSKMAPKKYGERVVTEHAGDPENPIRHKVEADAAFAEIVGALDSAARAKSGGTGG